MAYDQKEHSITITAKTSESFESVMREAQQRAEGFLDSIYDEEPSEVKLNLDHITSSYQSYSRYDESEKWTMNYEFTLHYQTYKKETPDERLTRNCRGMRLKGESQVAAVEINEEVKERVAKRLKEVNGG